MSDVPAPAYPSAIARCGGRTPRALRKILCLEDFESAARRRLPRFLFGYIQGGAEGDATVAANRRAFRAWRFRPRVLVGTANRSQRTPLFGRHYAAPFGIPPMGGIALVSCKADVVLARTAAAAHIPFVLSGASLVALEEVIKANPDAWFQAYVSGDRARMLPLLDRVARAGYRTLVVTADVQVAANRENNARNGLNFPLGLPARLRLTSESLTHPRWLFGTMLKTLAQSGVPYLENMAATRGKPMLAALADPAFDVRDTLSWDDIAWLRERWPGKLVVKGILSASDVKRARAIGLDGVVISNHGGRQLDFALASLPALAAAASEAGAMAVMLDGGIRRGTDVLKALALGARFVFVGRPFFYAAALAGGSGVAHAISLLSEEIDRDLAMLGCTQPGELGRDWLVPAQSVIVSGAIADGA